MVEFKVGDNAVYPGHGVGTVVAIETKEILGKRHSFYSIVIQESGMKIMVPQGNVASVGLRPIISKGEADEVLKTRIRDRPYICGFRSDPELAY